MIAELIALLNKRGLLSPPGQSARWSALRIDVRWVTGINFRIGSRPRIPFISFEWSLAVVKLQLLILIKPNLAVNCNVPTASLDSHGTGIC